MFQSRYKMGRGIRKRKDGASYEKMMKTLLLQNQQIIIQQQNMMFMVIKQLQHQSSTSTSVPSSTTNSSNITTNSSNNLRNIHNLEQQQPSPSTNNQPQQHQHLIGMTQQHHSTVHHQQTPTSSNQHQLHHQEETSLSQSQQQVVQQQINYSHGTPTTNHIISTQQQLQQVASQLQENLGNYLTPAASEQDPISDKPEDEDLVALYENDGLLQNNLLYNPQTDIGQITPYKSHNHPIQHQQTPSYYSSGCESLTTPRVEQQRQPTTSNINQAVVKNLADSFKSPTKPKINIQIMSGSATGSMKNSKAKIIQRMNISEFLRHVHPDNEGSPRNATQ